MSASSARDVRPLSMTIVALALGSWLAILVVATLAGVPQRLTPPVPQLILATLTLTLIVIARANASLRSFILESDWRSLTGIHVLRALAGAGFLWAATQGTLARQFALTAGYGDIVVGLFALVLILFISPMTESGARFYLVWNTAGMIDLLYVVGNAARIAIADPPAMSQLMRPPFVLLPLFYVPLLIASHFWLFELILRRARSMSPSTQ